MQKKFYCPFRNLETGECVTDMDCTEMGLFPEDCHLPLEIMARTEEEAIKYNKKIDKIERFFNFLKGILSRKGKSA